MSCACVSDISSTLRFALFTVSLIFHLILLIFNFILNFHVDRFGVNPLCTLENEEPDTLVDTAPLSWFTCHHLQSQRCQLAGFVITSTHLPVVMVVTASARFWKDCTALELKQRRYLRTRVSAVFLVGFFVTLTHAVISLVILLSAHFPARLFCSSEEAMESPTSCVSTASSSGESFAHNTWNLFLELLFHEHISSTLILFVDDFDLAKIALSCHFALNLLCYQEGAHRSV